jgi:hypothetical protein
MDKGKNKNKSTVKKVIKIALLIPLVLLGLGILFLIGVFATSPIFDKFDQERFKKLDTQMQNLYQNIKQTSDESDEWKYSAVCTPERSGWAATGRYHCVTSISTQKNVTSVQEINDLQSKYYPIIDKSDKLTSKAELDPQYPDDFGKKFVVSSAEKRYISNGTGIGCKYLIKLFQSIDNERLAPEAYGSEITGDTGNVVVSLRCTDIARKAWYPLSKTADLLIP